jgi:adenylate kinase family enzyme
LIGYYKNKGIVKSVSGTGSIDEIFKKVTAALGL